MSLFNIKSRKPAPAPATTFALPVLNELTLEQKLKKELRTCPTCSYSVNNPMTDRCPRCFSLIPLSEHTNCGECSHQGDCTYKP
jgi:uncharacterized paraquat-inducible protein A